MTHTFRYLRIAFTALCGLVAVAFCVLWMRSYLQPEYWHVSGRLLRHAEFHSECGELRFAHIILDEDTDWSGSFFDDVPYDGLFLKVDDGLIAVGVPYWALFLIFLAFALVGSGVRHAKRFSLRTLLIAMMLGSIALGLVVWLIR